MKRFFQLRSIFILSLGLLLFNACTPDETDPVAIPPSSFFGNGGLTGDATLSASDTIKVTLDATKGDNSMNLVEFRKDGELLDASLITINGTTAASNRILLFDTERDAFTWEITILPHTTGAATYEFIIEDDAATANTSTETIIITIEDAEPMITLSAGGAYIAAANMLAGFDITVETNGVDLTTLEVQQEGVTIAESDRLFLNGITAADELTPNPFTLPADLVGGFAAADMFVRAQGTTNTTVNYTVIVTNAGGKTASADFTITTSGTDIDATFTGVLLENATSVNLSGGMNLYDGTDVSVNSPDANIIDQGEDNLDNWLQQIGTANGSNLRQVSADQISGGFVFDDILFKEEIVSTWNGGDALSLGISDVVVLNDVFIVEVPQGGGLDYFLIKCIEINPTPQANSLDNYKFDIKKADFL